MKDTQVLNVNATKFEVLSHVSEREEQSKTQASADGAEKSLKGQFPLRFGLDTMLDCVKLTKEMIQREVLYGVDSERES